jgi:hypothetical protein
MRVLLGEPPTDALYHCEVLLRRRECGQVTSSITQHKVNYPLCLTVWWSLALLNFAPHCPLKLRNQTSLHLSFTRPIKHQSAHAALFFSMKLSLSNCSIPFCNQIKSHNAHAAPFRNYDFCTCERECCVRLLYYSEGALHIHDALIILSSAFLLATQNEVIAAH